MKSFFQKKPMEKKSFNESASLELSQLHRFRFLKNNDVISAQISDHHPIIHDNVLFWNVMMQGKKRKDGAGYNNGFGIDETAERYNQRLINISHIIAEIIYRHPSIDAITLCEGPIDILSLLTMKNVLKEYTHMKKFLSDDTNHGFHKPMITGMPDWGLLMLTDQRYKVSPIEDDSSRDPTCYKKLANRFQIWMISNPLEKKFLMLAHFPFGTDEHVTQKENLSSQSRLYIEMIEATLKKFSDERFILCADFNFNPYLIGDWKKRILDQISNNNSILLINDDLSHQVKTQPVTVDGILLSKFEKQRYQYSQHDFGLFEKLKQEAHLLKINTDSPLEEKNKNAQRLPQSSM